MSSDQRNIVSIFGAGASSAAGGVLLSELLRSAFNGETKPKKWAQPLREFFEEVFFVDFGKSADSHDWPDFGLVLGLIDQAIGDGCSLVGSKSKNPKNIKAFSQRDLVRLREFLDVMICDVVLPGYDKVYDEHEPGANGSSDLDKKINRFAHEMFFDYLWGRDREFKVISLNYDMFVDRAACQHLALLSDPAFNLDLVTPRYNIHFEDEYEKRQGARVVHKLHGSLDWATCPVCGRIYLLFSKHFRKNIVELQDPTWDTSSLLQLEDFYEKFLEGEPDAEPHTSKQGNQYACTECGNRLRPVIVAPTALKNYSNPHIRHVWSHAERSLRSANELYFVGYSLPTDDLAFIAMLKRSTQQVPRGNIYVINKDNKAIQRYKAIFGSDIKVPEQNFYEWVVEQKQDIKTYEMYDKFFDNRNKLIAIRQAEAKRLKLTRFGRARYALTRRFSYG